MNKLIFTKLRGRTASVLVSDKRILQINFEGEKAAEQIGTIYIGKVRNVVKNLNAAFVEYEPGVNGYYSLNDNKVHTFADGRREACPLKSGDEIVVQISRAAVKTKDAVLSSELTITGHLAAVMVRGREAEQKLGISAKIKDKARREEIKQQFSARKEAGEIPSQFDMIVRTNAYQAEEAELWNEVSALKARLQKILSDAAYRTPFSVLFRPDTFAKAEVRELRMDDVEEVITDLPDIMEELKDSRCAKLLRFYEDEYPLSALYHLETSLERALSKNVWLKSGGYLVIEPTEAMTVIDVNTGKNTGKKSPEETYFNTNLEAAAEIAAQLRLRNLSGIIIVDFIDMNDETHNTELLSAFRRYLAADPVKTALVDMTALGLVEVTRKKVLRPLHETFRT